MSSKWAKTSFQKGTKKGVLRRIGVGFPTRRTDLGHFGVFLGKSVGYRKPDFLAVLAIGQFRPSKLRTHYQKLGSSFLLSLQVSIQKVSSPKPTCCVSHTSQHCHARHLGILPFPRAAHQQPKTRLRLPHTNIPTNFYISTRKIRWPKCPPQRTVFCSWAHTKKNLDSNTFKETCIHNT